MPGLTKSCANVQVRKTPCDCGRALATTKETMYKQEQSRVGIAKKRPLECPVEAASRKEQNRATMMVKNGFVLHVTMLCLKVNYQCKQKQTICS